MSVGRRQPQVKNTSKALLVFCLFSLAAYGGSTSYIGLPASASNMIITTDAPANHVVTAPSSYNGVAELILTRTDGTFGCSASLIGASDLLTAAHCLANGSGANVTTGVSAIFEGGAINA